MLALLQGLLARDPAKRLGSTASEGGPPDGGCEAIKRHPFFRSINWAKLEARLVDSKFKPGVTCGLSVANFDKVLGRNKCTLCRPQQLSTGAEVVLPVLLQVWTDLAPEDSPCGTPNTGPDGVDAHFHGFTFVEPSALLKRAEGATSPIALHK